MERERAVYRDARWRAVRERLRSTQRWCEFCSAHEEEGARLSVHHEPALVTILNQGLDPFDPSFLVVLCAPCHRAADDAQRERRGTRWDPR
ncbi:MAG: hypothetical protein OXG37_09950 [Actinomycetia bacterium]|nr:hypothetical protein [Actinomycetes bacterium]